MNSIWNKNIAGFSARFPQLFRALSKNYHFITSTDERTILSAVQSIEKKFDITVSRAKNGEFTATIQGRSLHSAYNPSAEAQKNLNPDITGNSCGGVFFGFGLGYILTEFAKFHRDKTVVAVEWQPEMVFWAFYYRDFQEFFTHPKCSLLINASPNTVLQILENPGIERYYFFNFDIFKLNSSDYYANLLILLERNVKKKEMNEATLEKFRRQWFRNLLKNLSTLKNCVAVKELAGKGGKLPALVICAGPTLDEIAPQLSQVANRCITICCDTALRLCLKNGMEPNFVISTDPQYWNFCHLATVDSPNSVLITDLTAFPALLRKKFANICLCSSLYPLAKFCQDTTEDFGTLGSGGSVATTAWDFARFLGCEEIFIAGLDLSFPGSKTHFAGSTFEENAHKNSSRLKTAENFNVSSLFSGNYTLATSMKNKPVGTDARFSMFAWWFESHFEKHKQVTTFALSENSLKIPGMKQASLEKLIVLPEITEKIRQITEKIRDNPLSFQGNEIVTAIYNKFREITTEIANLQNESDIFVSEAKLKGRFPQLYPLVCPSMKEFSEILASKDKKTAFAEKITEKTDFYIEEGYNDFRK